MGKISNYTQVSASKLADKLVCDQEDSGVTSTKSVSIEQIGNAVNALQVRSDLDTQAQTIVSAINEINNKLFIPDTASGAIASFSTSLSKPLVDCTVDVGATTVKRFGKNFLALATNPTTVGNYTITETANGITISGTDTTSRDVYLFNGYLKAGTYTLFDSVVGSSSTHQLTLKIGSDTTKYTTTTPRQFTISNETDLVQIRLFIYPGYTDTLVKPQLEVGSDATAYEAFNGNTYPVADIDTITTLQGVNNIFADSGDISVTYLETIKDYIDKAINP